MPRQWNYVRIGGERGLPLLRECSNLLAYDRAKSSFALRGDVKPHVCGPLRINASFPAATLCFIGFMR